MSALHGRTLYKVVACFFVPDSDINNSPPSFPLFLCAYVHCLANKAKCKAGHNIGNNSGNYFY